MDELIQLHLVYGVFERILHMLATDAFTVIKSHSTSVKNDLQMLQETLCAIGAKLSDVYQKVENASPLIVRHQVQDWVYDLKQVAYDIEDLLDLAATQHLEQKIRARHCLSWIVDKWMSPHPSNFGSELKLLLGRLDELADIMSIPKSKRKGDVLPAFFFKSTTARDTSFCNQKLTSEDDIVVGREEDKERIIQFMLRSSTEVHPTVIIVSGSEGIGKTTLVKLVCHDSRVSSSFDLVMRVFYHPNVSCLILDILRASQSGIYRREMEISGTSTMGFQRRAGSHSGLYEQEVDMEWLKHRLCVILQGEKYLLVLDDFLIEDSTTWKELRKLLEAGAAGSTVILIQRPTWYSPCIESTGNFRLQGISEYASWYLFKRCASFDEAEQLDPLLDQIGRSIVKKCRGSPLAIKTMASLLRTNRDMNLWKQIERSEFWDEDEVKTALLLKLKQLPLRLIQCYATSFMFAGANIMSRDQLIYIWMAQGLLQPTEENEDLRDVGNRFCNELLSRNFLQLCPSDSLHNECSLAPCFTPRMNLQETANLDESRGSFGAINSRHFLWNGNQREDNVQSLAYLRYYKKARTVLLMSKIDSVSKYFLQGLFSNFRFLRVLLLNRSEFKKLPESIGSLKLLRYLSLAGNHKFEVLPLTICQLVNLQTLDFSGYNQLKTLPRDMHKLVSLRHLLISLKLTSLPEKVLSRWTSLHLLKISKCQFLNLLPNGIGSLTALRSLQIHDCASIASLPNSIKCLTNLKELSILNCPNLDLIGWEGLLELRSLKLLQFQGLPRLREFPDGLQSAADSLEHLVISSCKNLRTLPESLGHCTSLLELIIESSPNMLSLPRGTRALRNLQVLKISNCPNLVQRCQRDIGDDWDLISHIPRVYLYEEASSNWQEHPELLQSSSFKPTSYCRDSISQGYKYVKDSALMMSSWAVDFYKDDLNRRVIFPLSLHASIHMFGREVLSGIYVTLLMLGFATYGMLLLSIRYNQSQEYGTSSTLRRQEYGTGSPSPAPPAREEEGCSTSSAPPSREGAVSTLLTPQEGGGSAPTNLQEEAGSLLPSSSTPTSYYQGFISQGYQYVKNIAFMISRGCPTLLPRLAFYLYNKDFEGLVLLPLFPIIVMTRGKKGAMLLMLTMEIMVMSFLLKRVSKFYFGEVSTSGASTSPVQSPSIFDTLFAESETGLQDMLKSLSIYIFADNLPMEKNSQYVKAKDGIKGQPLSYCIDEQPTSIPATRKGHTETICLDSPDAECKEEKLDIQILGAVDVRRKEKIQAMRARKKEKREAVKEANEKKCSECERSLDDEWQELVVPSSEMDIFSKGVLFLLGEEYEFDKDKLIQLWMAGGFIKDEPMEIIGAYYFEKLVFEGYILSSDANSIYKVNSEQVNSDLEKMRDKSNYVRLGSTSQINAASTDVLHVSLACDDIDEKVFKTLKGFNRLRTLLFLGNYGSRLQQVRDRSLSYGLLVILDLSGTHIKELPSSMGKQLRYLDLSWTFIELLPETTNHFQGLQTLKLKGCSRLLRLPREMKRLIQLRHLDLNVIGQLSAMPEGMGALVNLRTLPAFIVGTQEGCKIRELRNLNNLTGEFRIARLENVHSADEAEEALLGAKRNLKKLELRWSDFQIQEMKSEDDSVLENLCPHLHLEELRILCYNGTSLPTWIADESFHKLVSITLIKCERVSMLPSVNKLPSLESLELFSLNSVTRMDCTGEVGNVAFPKLKKLVVDEMLNLETWTEAGVGDCPCLVDLTLKYCPKLPQLPSILYLPTIRHLEISGFHQLTFARDKEFSTSLELLIIEDCPLIKERCSKHKIANVQNVWIDQEAVRTDDSDSDSDSEALTEEECIDDDEHGEIDQEAIQTDDNDSEVLHDQDERLVEEGQTNDDEPQEF